MRVEHIWFSEKDSAEREEHRAVPAVVGSRRLKWGIRAWVEAWGHTSAVESCRWLNKFCCVWVGKTNRLE